MGTSEILLTVMLAGFAVNFALLMIIWRRIERLEDKIIDMDKRLFAIESMLHMKDCCILKEDRNLKKAE